jgi:Protein of unknown function (DUF3047)
MTLSGVALFMLASGCATVPESLSSTVILPYVSNFSENKPGEDVPRGWENWTLSKFKKPTQYRLVSETGRTVVKASADASASGLVHNLRLDRRTYPLLTWRWKVDELIAKADNTKKHAEDSPVRVVVSFQGNMDKLSFDDRIFFDNIRALTGQELPYATLMYIWENRVPKGTVIPNPHTSRIKMIVAESGREKLGLWQDVTRNIYEDFKHAFGEDPGQVSAIGIMTDTDNTGENVHAYYGDIVFRRVAPPRMMFATD